MLDMAIENETALKAGGAALGAWASIQSDWAKGNYGGMMTTIFQTAMTFIKDLLQNPGQLMEMFLPAGMTDGLTKMFNTESSGSDNRNEKKLENEAKEPTAKKTTELESQTPAAKSEKLTTNFQTKAMQGQLPKAFQQAHDHNFNPAFDNLLDQAFVQGGRSSVLQEMKDNSISVTTDPTAQDLERTLDKTDSHLGFSAFTA